MPTRASTQLQPLVVHPSLEAKLLPLGRFFSLHPHADLCIYTRRILLLPNDRLSNNHFWTWLGVVYLLHFSPSVFPSLNAYLTACSPRQHSVAPKKWSAICKSRSQVLPYKTCWMSTCCSQWRLLLSVDVACHRITAAYSEPMNKWPPEGPFIKGPAQVLKTQSSGFLYFVNPPHIGLSSFPAAFTFLQNYCLFRMSLVLS